MGAKCYNRHLCNRESERILCRQKRGQRDHGGRDWSDEEPSSASTQSWERKEMDSP